VLSSSSIHLHFQLARALQAAGHAGEAKAAMANYQALRSKLGAASKELEAETQIAAPPPARAK